MNVDGGQIINVRRTILKRLQGSFYILNSGKYLGYDVLNDIWFSLYNVKFTVFCPTKNERPPP